jgi:hypothetical protein
MAVPFAAILDVGLKVLDRVLPDPKAKAEAQMKLLELQQAGALKELDAEMQLALGQLEVNKAEAAAPDAFRGGWRPFIGWVCGTALAFQFVVRPFLMWLAPAIGLPAGMPELDMGDLMTVLLGMLGLGGLRTFERVKGKV